MDSEILVTQVADGFADEKFETHALRKFFNQIPGKINYPKILYRMLESGSVINGLKWLTRNFEIDLLVLVHRKRNFLQNLFSGSITQLLAALANKPLLIFPSYKVKERLTIF